jgi:hypothetical protein
MITVRYPNGTAVTYNDATKHENLPSGSIQLLYVDQKGRSWIHAILTPGSGAIVEWVKPCRFQNDLSPRAAADLLVAACERKSLDGATAAKLKRALRSFNLKTRRWNP